MWLALCFFIAPFMSAPPELTKAQLTRLLRECQAKKDVHCQAVTHLLLGRSEMNLYDAASARSDLDEAAKLMRAQNDVVGTCLTLLAQSRLERISRRSDRAMAYIRDALTTIDNAARSNEPLALATYADLRSGSDPPPSKSLILRHLLEPMAHDIYGVLLIDANRLDEAEAQLNAASAGAQHYNRLYEFSIAAHVGDLRFRQARDEEARVWYQKALSGWVSSPLNPMSAPADRLVIYDRLAHIEIIAGHPDEAIRWNDKALDFARSAEMPLQLSATLDARGELLMRLRRLVEAEQAFRQALTIADANRNAALQAAIESHLGTLEMTKTSYGSAAAHLERSIHLFQSVSDPVSEAAVWGLLSVSYYQTENLDAASDALAHARKLLADNDYSFGRDMIGMWDAELRHERGQAAQADVDANVQRFTRNAQIADTAVARAFEDLFSALKASDEGEFKATHLPSDDAAFAAFNDASAGLEESQKGNFEEARKHWRHALEYDTKDDQRSGLMKLIGVSYYKERNFAQAAHWLSEAMALVDQASEDLQSEPMLISYLGQDTHSLSYGILIESLLQSGNVEEAFDTTERARARAFLRILGNHRLKPPPGTGFEVAREAEEVRRKIAESETQPLPTGQFADLRRRYEALRVRVQASSPEYGSMTRVAPLQLDAIRKELPEDTTLLSYFITPAGVQAWIVDAETLKHVKLSAGDAEWNRVKCWANQLSSVRGVRPIGDERCSAATSTEAYLALIEPLRSMIRKRRLMIVPHGDLHYVPFAALYDSRHRKYLVEDYPITYLPSASTLRFLRRKETPVHGAALILGDPARSSRSRLPGADTEARRVAALLHTSAHLGRDAQKSLLYRLDGKIDLLHIAAHATYDATSPLFSAVFLADGRGHDGPLTVEEIESSLDLTGVNLVVLSACQSGLGKRSGGDEIVGLTRSILYAGSPGVISTLWNIDDEKTPVLIERFYDHLLAGDSVANALRDAQIDLLRNPKYADPKYWAAFVLTGDPKGRWNVARPETRKPRKSRPLKRSIQ